MLTFGTIWALAVTGRLTFPLLFCLVLLSGCAMVFFQVAYTSYLPGLYGDPDNLHRGNARLAPPESVSKALGPMAAGPVIGALGFTASVVSLALIRHREPTREVTRRERGWLRRDIATGLRFALGHPMLQPILLCGTTYVLFLSMVETSLVLYCRNVLGLPAQWIGVVIGAAAAGYPIGNLLSARLIRRFGTPCTLVAAASVSVQRPLTPNDDRS